MSNGLRQEDPLRHVLEKEAVIAAINRLFRSVDQMDWASAERCFAPAVWFDMSSAGGGEPRDTTPAEIVDGWRESLGHLKAMHHQAGNYAVEVNGQEAEASCYGIAYHYLPNGTGRDTRTFVGTYDVRLRKHGGTWSIDRLLYNLKFGDGNLDLEGGGGSD
jgi:SnoaL-like domain